jgi:3-phosphoshikimate 1-carboxyvinyltransferase
LPQKKLKDTIHISQRTVVSGTVSLLPASKSLSNRALILAALARGESTLKNLSDANDTQLMQRLINSPEKIIDVEDAGTTMRFLTAYFAATNQSKILTGTPRMKQRPIGILVDALRKIGAEVSYLEKEGYPPHELISFSSQLQSTIEIQGNVSSQFISALMMIAPNLPNGLSLRLLGKVGSLPYIKMTKGLMQNFGVEVDLQEASIDIASQPYSPATLTIESDWSNASYWFAFTALAREATIILPRLFKDSLQGDQAIITIMDKLGVSATWQGEDLLLTKKDAENDFTWDFTHCPDLAQTVAVVCAAKGITASFTGLESLRIKETDRISALQNELRKIGGDFIETDHHWEVIPSEALPLKASFETYEDHRMAMAFAPLAALMDVEIHDPKVVRKSYPTYWDDLRGVGFTIQ